MADGKNLSDDKTRKEMTEDEKQWEKKFDSHRQRPSEKKLKSLSPDQDHAERIILDNADAYARKSDVFVNFKRVSVKPIGNTSWDEAFDNFIENDSVSSSSDHYIEDPTLNPAYPEREKEDRYTTQDYQQPYPDEDAMNAA